MSSLKELTRVHRESGLHTEVSKCSYQENGTIFLREAKNKKKLFDILSEKMKTMVIPENKVTSENRVVCKGIEYEMPQCNHEEADTRIIINVQDSLQRGTNTIMIRIVDTNIIVLLIGHFYALLEHNPNADIWVAFGTGKHFCYYHINTICANLGFEKVRDFHLFMHFWM